MGRPGAEVRWKVAGRMAAAWLITLPAAALVGAVMWFVAHSIGGAAGAVVVFAILVDASVGMWLRSRLQPVGAHNVNHEWSEAPTTAAQPSVNV